MALDYAIHSDFLVHWTGKDLDCSFDPQWHQRSKSSTEGDLTERYLERLRGILKYGLWLTTEPEQKWQVCGVDVIAPSTAKTCFTELKLSESRNHARQYGRLGIGVKRPYVFNRNGRPVVYFGFKKQADHDHFLKSCAEELSNSDFLNFFKPMNSSDELNYDWYSESEWRILFMQGLLDSGFIIDPRDPKNVDAHKYFQTLTSAEQSQLKYLAPLDAWFTLLIYPSLAVKNAAQQCEVHDIRHEINRIKRDPQDRANRVEGGNWPVEVELDSCRNF